MNLKTFLNRIKPGVSKNWLFLLAGLMWSGVGILLCSFSYRWLTAIHTVSAVIMAVIGILCAIVIYKLGFLRIAKKNIARINAILEKVCLFSFMPAKSYLLVACMMTLGIVLRNSSLPRLYLSILYTGIGTALFLSSLHYYPRVFDASSVSK